MRKSFSVIQLWFDSPPLISSLSALYPSIVASSDQNSEIWFYHDTVAPSSQPCWARGD